MGFAAKGINVDSTRTRDGQKFFDCRHVTIPEIINVPLNILDFEANIATRDLRDQSKQNKDRYVVLASLRTTGEKVKFITSAYHIKSVLDAAREAEQAGQKIFPVENVAIQRLIVGTGKQTYKFIDL